MHIVELACCDYCHRTGSFYGALKLLSFRRLHRGAFGAIYCVDCATVPSYRMPSHVERVQRVCSLNCRYLLEQLLANSPGAAMSLVREDL